MADGHGGYRAPSSPAAVSGPGALSARTDGGPSNFQPERIAPGGEYGSRKQMEAIQGGAPMQGGGGGTTPPPNLTPLDAPTARPDEAVTTGADAGAGADSAAAGILNTQQQSMAQLRPVLRSLEDMANLPGANAETRAIIRRLKANS